MTFDFLVFIGRFQPFHKGHEQIIKQGLKLSRKVIIFCGSAYKPRSSKNPWTAPEREQMIRGCFSKRENERIIIYPLSDIPNDNKIWVESVQAITLELVNSKSAGFGRKPKIGLIGHAKDHSSYYLKLFPEWDSVSVENFHGINSTSIRDILFKEPVRFSELEKMVPRSVYTYLKTYIGTLAVSK